MRNKLKLIGLGLVLIFLSSYLFINNLSSRISKYPPTPSQDEPQSITPKFTGDLRQIISNFTQWNTSNCAGSNNLLRLREFSNSTPLLAMSGDYYIYHNGLSGNYQNTWSPDGSVWSMYEKDDHKTCYLRCYFTNPQPNRQYYKVEFTNRVQVHSDYNLDGCISVTLGTSHPTQTVQMVEGDKGFTQVVNLVPRHYEAYDTYVYSDTSSYNFNNNILGAIRANQIQTIFWRWEDDLLDNTNLWWDYAKIALYWYEFRTLGDATSPIISLSDGDHTYKQLHNITFQGSLNGGTAQLLYKVNSPLGWSNWIPTTNGTAINALAKQVQCKFTLTPSAPLNQKSPLITSLTVNYGNPSPASAPEITGVQQQPGRLEVGYKDAVNVSCYVETYAPLVRVVINVTTNNWGTFTLYGMHDNFNFTGKCFFTGQIPAQPTVGTLVQYKIFAENKGPDEKLRNMTSIKYDYNIIDNVPPIIIHLNSSDWVNPLYPLPPPMTSSVFIECKVEDVSALNWVRISYAIMDINDVIIQEDTKDMVWNGVSLRYGYLLNLPIDSKIIDYDISAQDNRFNLNVTPQFSITIDRSPPTVVSWEIPADPEYDDPVVIWANITDPNAKLTPGAVLIEWTNDNWADPPEPSRTMVYQYGDTWIINQPISPQPWHTVVKWKITATDLGGNTAIKFFSYRTEDYTDPRITHLEQTVQVIEGYPCVINITVDEIGSGIDLGSSYLLYYLRSEGTPHYIYGGLWDKSGGSYGIVIPAQTFNESVAWQIHLTDRAENSIETEWYFYTVVEKTGLINWINFIIWILIILFITGAMVVGRRHARSTRLTGSKFVGLGAACVIGATAIIWMTPISWWNLHNLSFFDYLAHLGGSEAWTSTLIVLFGMFFILAASMGALYYADRRATERQSPVLRQIEEDLSRF